jgi:hypothetical protein
MLRSILSLLLHMALGTAVVYLFFWTGLYWGQGHLVLSIATAALGVAICLISVVQFMVHLAVETETASPEIKPPLDPVQYTLANVARSLLRASFSTWLVAILVREPSVLGAGALFACLEVCLAVWCSRQGLQASSKHS